jgi:hypothetical protein
MNPADRQSIEHFVRGTLGCHCPDDVFQSIAIERVPTPRHALPHTRLVIASDHPTELLTAARTSFESVAGTDNRTHLHILATDQLPAAIRLKSSAKVSGAG